MKYVGEAESYVNYWLSEGYSVPIIARLIIDNPPILTLLLAKSGHSGERTQLMWTIIQAACAIAENSINTPDEDIDFPEWDNSKTVSLDPFDTTLLGSGIPNYALDPKFKQDFPPLPSGEELEAINKFVREHDQKIEAARFDDKNVFHQGKGFENGFDSKAAWIQTHSGRRFNPTNPNPDAIVIQDVAHALSMQCRFSGHCREFYSVAQHSVLVSYICDSKDALWGLLHDASEAYLVDVPRPIKRSGHFQAYIDFEHKMQEAICRRFALPQDEPPSVKAADTKLLATEARDLMSPLHPDWQQPTEPLPFKIEPWGHKKAKDMFMKRFFELTAGDSASSHYEHYLMHRERL